MSKIPTRMQALSLPEYNVDLHAALRSISRVERPVPRPGPGQILIKMLAAPCNPSDLLHLQNRYGIHKSLPSVPGWEGAGEVVSSGGGLMARALVGRTVACASQGDSDGTWAEYLVADANRCVPLLKGLGVVQGSMLIVNPVTALAMLDTASKRLRSPAVINLAAASQLGRMIIVLAKAQGYPVINVVRREAQVELLRGLGAEHVLLSADPDHEDALRALAARLDARVALDPIGGERTGQVLRAMPRSSRVLVYGSLSGALCSGIDPLDLIFEDKHVSGFWLTKWFESQNLASVVMKTRALQKLMIEGTLRAQVRVRVGFDGFAEALREYTDDMTGGKVILEPGR